ncbi:hypothetical protein LS70_006015 [Helicobacter sp. MIT 11-5569]|uniref:hypothetical protein n=1 Tax=Helicobacter sp. MIT 11-5569 TaxID=1548151 RepID=UPI00068D5249|nr:hypothetical protein [Helicobacter sp. MIT 11-5569]TLD83297.1 hypothetical protein LS70_006015 [Helicobacter sp. MIT 11-5569]
MQTKLNSNTTKRISFYTAIIVFIAYLIITNTMRIIDNKKADNLINNAKAELAPLSQWYKEDSTKELESIQNLTKESFDALNVNALIYQNLQDIKKMIDNAGILKDFIFSYSNGDENGAWEIFANAIKAVEVKDYIIIDLLDKERALYPNQTYYILHDKERVKYLDDFQSFLETYIANNVPDFSKQEKASLHEVAFYYAVNANYYSLGLFHTLADIEEHTCDIDRVVVRKTLSRYELLQRTIKSYLSIFNKKIATSSFNEEQKKILTTTLKVELNNLDKMLDELEVTSISDIKSRFKECQ